MQNAPSCKQLCLWSKMQLVETLAMPEQHELRLICLSLWDNDE